MVLETVRQLLEVFGGTLIRSLNFLVAGRTVLPLIVNDMFRIANSSDPLKLAYNAGSYKPFISLFKMTGAADENPELRGFGMQSPFVRRRMISLTSHAK